MSEPANQQARWEGLAAAPADEMFGRLVAAEKFAVLFARAARDPDMDIELWDPGYTQEEILDALTAYVPRGARVLPRFMMGFTAEVNHLRRTVLRG
ncbi:hypothetical protein [Candidatus Palauibacter sp.]|uniref:hypothetical protein n=1 Tax=Candidatus Palauibacter sp. TaxID=3101350 RepID=UPI003B0144DB